MGFNSSREIVQTPGEVLQFGAKRMRRTSVYTYESNEVYFASHYEIGCSFKNFTERLFWEAKMVL